MVFSSTVFVFFFLPVCLIAYYLVPGIRLKNLALLLCSLVFYAWGEPIYIALMLLSILANYWLGLNMERIPSWRKAILILGIIINLGLLGFFKYYGFLAENLQQYLGIYLENRNLPLPIGISFYTFQALSYLIDLYRRKIGVQKDLPAFALYIAMFPQLIAGPIVRYATVEQQLGERNITREGLSRGMIRFIIGLAKKLLVANQLGALHEASAMQQEAVAGIAAWIGLIAFALQIYFDFSGYSDMAIGLGQMLGFEFTENFDAPYSARSVSDFWRRWHISLGSWFREYVYIPLGGNRRGAGRQFLNILLVWLLTGLWHGAAWNFVLWGLYHAAALLLDKYIFSKWKSMPAFLGNIITLTIVFLGWGIFLCDTPAALPMVFSNLLGLGGQSFVDAAALRLLVTGGITIGLGILCCTPILLKLRVKLTEEHFPLMAVICFFLLILCTAFLVTQNYNPFLYFRF